MPNNCKRFHFPRPLAVFLAVVLACSAAAYVWIHAGGPDWLYPALMWTPALAAIPAHCVALRERGEPISLKGLLARSGLRRCNLRYVLMGLVFPLFYLLIPYLIYWQLYPECFVYHGVPVPTVLKDFALPLTVGTVLSLLTALGEELGWRGFLLPALYEQFGLRGALWISSLIWIAWHLPLLIGGDYMSGTPIGYRIPAFVLCVLPIGFLTGLLALESNSVWPGAWLHAAHNNYDQAVFGFVTAGAIKPFFVSETGILTIVCAWALAIVVLARVRRQAARGACAENPPVQAPKA